LPPCHKLRQSHLRPHPASHSAQWSLACDIANDLGLSGIPSAHVWEKIEREMTKKLSNIVAESTVQSRERLQNIETMLMHLQQHLGLQCPLPNGMHPVAEDMRKSASDNATAKREETKLEELVAHESASEAFLPYGVAFPVKPLPVAKRRTHEVVQVTLSFEYLIPQHLTQSNHHDSINNMFFVKATKIQGY